MPVLAPLAARNALAGLRRSVLGAWLAAVYALAVLAAALAPAPGFAAGIAGTLLCSGDPAPGPDLPLPAGEMDHCKGCPLNPVLAGPSSEQPAIAARAAQPVAPRPPGIAGLPHGTVTGLPGSRAPPALASQL